MDLSKVDLNREMAAIHSWYNSLMKIDRPSFYVRNKTTNEQDKACDGVDVDTYFCSRTHVLMLTVTSVPAPMCLCWHLLLFPHPCVYVDTYFCSRTHVFMLTLTSVPAPMCLCWHLLLFPHPCVDVLHNKFALTVQTFAVGAWLVQCQPSIAQVFADIHVTLSQVLHFLCHFLQLQTQYFLQCFCVYISTWY